MIQLFRQNKLTTEERDKLLMEFKSYYEDCALNVRKQIYWMVRNDELTDDLVQETFLKAWKAYPGFKGKSKFDTWIYRIASNLVHDFFRKNKNASVELIKEIDLESKDNDLSEKDHISRCLLEMKSTFREVFILFYKFDMTQEQISEFLDIPLGTVKSRLFKAKEKFKELYSVLGGENE